MSARHAPGLRAAEEVVAVGVVSAAVEAEVVASVAEVAEADAGHSSSYCSVNEKPLEVGCIMQPTSAVFWPP